MKIVSPFRPFAPEKSSHRLMEGFDWEYALRMLDYSARTATGVGIHVLTDRGFTTSLPTYRYRTESTRLMLWILEVTLLFLTSADFDEDTVFVSPDMLILRPLDVWFGDYDLGLLYRDQKPFSIRPILNGVQFFRPRHKERLVEFYGYVLRLARTMPEKYIHWGADTKPFVWLLEPCQLGPVQRWGITTEFLPAGRILRFLGKNWEYKDVSKRPFVMDFKSIRKSLMERYFIALFGDVL